MRDNLSCSAIAFDFDGTLADSMPFLEMIGVQVMMKYYGVTKEDATQKYRMTTGLPYEHQIEMTFPNDGKNHRAVEEFEKLKIDMIFDQALFSDTESTLKEIHNKGIDIFVSSSTFQQTITKYFEKKGMKHFFRDILGYSKGFEKGADHFNKIKSSHNIDLTQLIFVGDSLKDYERSKGFCQFIGVQGLFTPEDFIEAGHAGFVVSTLSEIPDLIKHI
ncbi:MAG: HAD family hydrolase [Candidatus Thorarchaeota archaeon]